LYLDFYNANPASMEDALETFYAIAPVSEPRLLVLGCMEELGPDAPLHHRKLGQSLQLRPQDRVYVIGGEAAAVVAGALEAGTPGQCIKFVDSLEPLAAVIATFQGAVFMKGSRRYGLEKALPPAVRPQPPASGGGGTGSGGRSASFALGRSASVLPSGWSFQAPIAVQSVRSGHGSFFL
jgi:hypothetical protein